MDSWIAWGFADEGAGERACGAFGHQMCAGVCDGAAAVENVVDDQRGTAADGARNAAARTTTLPKLSRVAVALKPE
jgi:hypothetical protein